MFRGLLRRVSAFLVSQTGASPGLGLAIMCLFVCACVQVFCRWFWRHQNAVLIRVFAKKCARKEVSAFKMCSKNNIKCPKYGPGTTPACSVVGTLLKLHLRRHLPAPGFHFSMYFHRSRRFMKIENEQRISLKKSTNEHLRLVRWLALSSSCACGAIKQTVGICV